jgi:hypothetical protein
VGTFASETGYYVQIAATAFDDTAGNSFTGIPDDTTWNFFTRDAVDPAVLSFSPGDGATGVGVNSNLVIVFSEPVDTVSGDITIRHSFDHSVFESIAVTSGQVTGTGTDTITIDPAGTFASETGYYVQIAATAFDDTAGNSYAGISDAATWNFTSADVAGPIILSLSPLDNSIGVGIDASLIINFDEVVDVESDSIWIRRSSDSSLFEAIELPDGRVTGTGTSTIVINPSATFASEGGYFVQISADAFDDPLGNSFAGRLADTTWNFTAEDVVAPGIFSLSPSDDTINVSVDADLVITFDEEVDVEGDSIWIRRSSDNSLFEAIELPDSRVTGTGTAVITINPFNTFSSETGM